MTLKTLRKKIRKLEIRLQEGPQKLAKMRWKLEVMTIAKARKAKASAPMQKEKSVSTAQRQKKAAIAQKRSPFKKAKRKLNLSPERRAQLAAAMKARWAAKKAAAKENLGKSPTEGDSASQENSQAR